MQEDRGDYIRARIEESPAIKLLNQYEELEYNEELPGQNQERIRGGRNVKQRPLLKITP